MVRSKIPDVYSYTSPERQKWSSGFFIFGCLKYCLYLCKTNVVLDKLFLRFHSATSKNNDKVGSKSVTKSEVIKVKDFKFIFGQLRNEGWCPSPVKW